MVKLAHPNVKFEQQMLDQSPAPDSGSSGIGGSAAQVGLANIIWAALEKIGGKEKRADELPQGSSHHISLRIEGEIDGQPFLQTVDSVVNVGHEQTKSSSATPQVPELFAYILSKLNRVTRDRILTDVPVEFAENGNRLPESRPILVEEARNLLKRLRTTRKIKSRGPIRCEYRVK